MRARVRCSSRWIRILGCRATRTYWSCKHANAERGHLQHAHHYATLLCSIDKPDSALCIRHDIPIAVKCVSLGNILVHRWQSGLKLRLSEAICSEQHILKKAATVLSECGGAGWRSTLSAASTISICYNLPALPFVGVGVPDIGVLVPEARLGGCTSRQASALLGWECIVSKRSLKYFLQLAFEGTKCPAIGRTKSIL